MPLPPRKNGLEALFMEARVFKVGSGNASPLGSGRRWVGNSSKVAAH